MLRKSMVDTETQRENPAVTAEQQRMVGKSSVPDFLDAALEWRRLFAEMWGTFLLVLVATGGTVIAARTGIAASPSALAIAPGIMVMVIIYTMGAVSGAHLNPAVTMAFALRRHFPWRRVPGYLLAQLLGGVLAALFLWAMFGDVGALGATLPGPGIGAARALIIETLLTAGLVNVILGTSSGARNIGTNGAIAVGGYIALAGILAASASGASMNPVRSFAPDLVRGDLAMIWIYVVGPFVGAAVGVAFEWILKGRPTVAGTIAAQGFLNSKDLSTPER
jgi:aquaporin Z